ncbi:GON domain-containing protein [Archangium violaceum]|uniref:GON domain-containing protein n=1 Tax=Archangium violaceum TaxID=83451 RepID=UPI002B2FC7D8|nr:GON domain-containing protein [Archangium gephyra]
MMHAPRWKKLMFAASLAVLPACGMEGSDSPESKELDPQASTEPGQTRAALTTGPASCQDIKTANPAAADGSYVLFASGDRSKPWTAWCHNMASTPAEYLSLPSTGSSANFSQYTAGYNNSGGTNVRTLFTRVRIDPSTLRVSTGDQTFSTSSGYLTHPANYPVTSMSYAAAMNCDFGNPGVGNVDLRGTPFAATPNQFVLVGSYPSGAATYSSDNQVVDLWSRGDCSWMSVQGADHPFNGRSAHLQLQYRPSTPASCQELKTAHPAAADGEYVLYVNGDVSKPWTAWCHNMASTPAEYLSLPSTGSSANFSQYTAGYNNSGGTNVRTLFSKVRIDPTTLRVSTGDQTFSTSSGYLTHPANYPVTSMSYAAAMNCDFGNPGVGNVDLRGTPFAAAPNQFVLVGSYPSGAATYSSNNQVVDLWSRGDCSWMSVQDADHPFNGRSAQLQLQYAPPPASPPQPTSGSFNYSASNTNSATQNTTPYDVTLTAGQTLSFGTCSVAGASGSGDTFLRLYAPDGSHVAGNDDACGYLSFVGFTATQTGTYRIQAGCYSSGSCNGTVAFTIQ